MTRIKARAVPQDVQATGLCLCEISGEGCELCDAWQTVVMWRQTLGCVRQGKDAALCRESQKLSAMHCVQAQVPKGQQRIAGGESSNPRLARISKQVPEGRQKNGCCSALCPPFGALGSPAGSGDSFLASAAILCHPFRTYPSWERGQSLSEVFDSPQAV